MMKNMAQSIKNRSDLESRAVRTMTMNISEKYGLSIRARSRFLNINRKAIIRRVKEKKNSRKKKTEAVKQGVQEFFDKKAVYVPDKKTGQQEVWESQESCRQATQRATCRVLQRRWTSSIFNVCEMQTTVCQENDQQVASVPL